MRCTSQIGSPGDLKILKVAGVLSAESGKKPSNWLILRQKGLSFLMGRTPVDFHVAQTFLWIETALKICFVVQHMPADGACSRTCNDKARNVRNSKMELNRAALHDSRWTDEVFT